MAFLAAGMLVLFLALWLVLGAPPASAGQAADRPTPTPATLMILNPDSGQPGTRVEAEGHGFPAGSEVTLTWNETITLTTRVRVAGDGTFLAQFLAPEDRRGYHTVRATADDPLGTFAEAVFRLIIPTRTPTPTSSVTPTPTWTGTPTWTPLPTHTPLPTDTPSVTPTFTPKPTLRPITPIYPSPTPYTAPPTATRYAAPPTATPYATAPTAMPTSTPARGTATLEPIPTPPLATPTVGTVAPMVTGTATPTAWLTPVATPTPRATPEGGLTATGGGPYFLLWGGALLLVVAMVAARWLRSVPTT